MGIVVNWDDSDQTIIRWDFGETWLWEDFHNAFSQSLDLSNAVSHRVDVIPYLKMTRSVPPNALAQFNRIQRQMPANTHLIVITGGNPFENAIISAFRAAYRADTWRTAKTLEDARALIQREREKSLQE